jgi:DNA polymerase-3 subunit alpha
MSRADRLNIEKQLIGFYFSGHPMDDYKEVWKNAVTVNLGDTENLKTGNCVLVGIIKNIKSITTAKGGKMAFAVLADYNGEIEVTFFSGAWERCMHRIEEDKVAILKGKIDYQKDRDKYSFLAENTVSAHEVNSVIKETKDFEEKVKVHKNTWTYMTDLKSSHLANAKKGNYTVIGYLKSLREFKDRNDNDMAFGALQDFEGDIDLVFFSRVYAECRHLLKIDEITALKGSIDPESERNPAKISFKVSSIADFAQLSRSAARREASGEEPPSPPVKKQAQILPDEVHIRLKSDIMKNDDDLFQLRDYLAENSGSCTMYIHIPVTGGEKTIRAVTGIEITAGGEAVEGLKKCGCVDEVWRK